MKNNKFAIFYSWQSYIGGYANRVYIKDKIISAFKELNIDIELLEDSRGTTGAPDIRKHSIFRHDNFIGCFSADKIKMSARK